MKVLSTSETGTTPFVRPLRELASLIKEDLRLGDEAAQQAGLPHYRAAGEKMLEAKGQMIKGEFIGWVERNFKVKIRQAQLYMSYASTTRDIEKRAAAPTYTSLNQFRHREDGGESTSNPSHRPIQPVWHDRVKDVIDKVDTDTLNMHNNEINRREDRDARRKLGLQLIDIGYKVLAAQLHPDKGGSKEAMARLNIVRDRLKQYV